jgi:hypothetical protein
MFSEIYRCSANIWDTFFHETGSVLILTKAGLGYTWGHFFTTSSSHPDHKCSLPQSKPSVNLVNNAVIIRACFYLIFRFDLLWLFAAIDSKPRFDVVSKPVCHYFDWACQSWWATIRVTRLGEFSPIGRLLPWASFAKNTEVGSANFRLLFPRYPLFINFHKKLVGPHFGQIFHQLILGRCYEQSQFSVSAIFPNFRLKDLWRFSQKPMLWWFFQKLSVIQQKNAIFSPNSSAKIFLKA